MKVNCRALMPILACLGLLAGCFGSTLDFRNAEVSNGKIYQRGANKPYSGKLTDVPAIEILIYQGGWGRALRGLTKTSSSIVKESLCVADVSDGYLDGKIICRLPRSEAVTYEFRLEKGLLDGDFRLYDGSDEKKPVVVASFIKGELDGPHQIFDAVTHKLRYQATYKERVLHGEEGEYDPVTAAKVASRPYNMGKLEGEAREYAPDGKTLVYRAMYKEGRRHGLEERFNAQTGLKSSEDGYLNGERHGPSKVWSSEGKLIANDAFEYGHFKVSPGLNEAAPTTTADGDKCMDQWMAAHRTQVGQDAPISADQLEEWQGRCKEGKLPS